MNNQRLSELRSKIDKIDREIIDLLAQRQTLIEEIGKYKSINGIKIKDRQREKEALKERYQLGEKKKLDKHQIKKLFSIIFKYSVSSQKKMYDASKGFDKNRHK